MDFTRVKIVTFAPLQAAEDVRIALGEAGAGVLGEYTYCSYSGMGSGHFLPPKDANPTVGTAGELTAVEEDRIEVTCDRDKAKAVIAAMKLIHPYEEVAFDIYPLLEVDQL